MDWYDDGETLCLNSQAYELQFVGKSGNKFKASSYKDDRWFTWTCVLGFMSQGVFQGVDGTDVNSVCRAKNRKVMATGDDFGKVNLFKYPSVVLKLFVKFIQLILLMLLK